MTLSLKHKNINSEHNIPYQGYLNQHPYLTTSAETLHYYYYSHSCPCCQRLPEELPQNLTDKLININQLQLCAISTPCICGFNVPFIAVVDHSKTGNINTSINNLHEPSDLKFTSGYDHNVMCENHLFHCSVLIHQKKYYAALSYLDQYTDLLNQYTLAHFYRAYCLEYTQQPVKALAAYDQCLDLDRYYLEAWHNKARLLKELEQYEEAQFHLTKYRQLTFDNNTSFPAIKQMEPSSNSLLPSSKVLYDKKGMFGNITVVQTPATRYLMIDQQIQGGFWLQQQKPSNIPKSSYTIGLLLSASTGEWQKGLILGLGAGAGIIALLANNSQLQLTVVEIDPVIIHAALQFFPLLNTYKKQGRLKIFEADAYQYITVTQQYYDVIFLDIYQGNNNPPTKFLNKGIAQHFLRISKHIVINLVCENDLDTVMKFHKYYSSIGINFLQAIPITPSKNNKETIVNWILLTHLINKKNKYQPYINDNSYLAKSFRRDTQQIKQTLTNLDDSHYQSHNRL